MQISSFRQRLHLVFGFFSVAFLLILIGTTIYFKKKDDLSSVANTLNQMERGLLKDINAQNNFFNQESTRDLFFETGRSPFLDQHNALQQRLNALIIEVGFRADEQGFDMHDKLDSLSKHLKHMRSDFNLATRFFYERGFKDHGLEGNMRSFIHDLEAIPSINREQILSLRRREKDYIMRQEDKYIALLKREADSLERVINQSLRNKQVKLIALEKLERYRYFFGKLVDVNKELGFANRSGIIGEMDQNNEKLLELVGSLIDEAKARESMLFMRFRNLYWVGLCLFVLFALIATAKISKSITKPIQKLSANIQTFVSTGFQEAESPTFHKHRKDEFGALGQNFDLLVAELSQHINHFKEMVDKRTLQLSQQNEALLESKALIQSQNKDILDSIKYAERIQKSLLPNKAKMAEIIPHHFLMFQPKDIVSGDFYWMHQREDYLFLGVGDCTGHGVPGAFMSLLALNSLNEIVERRKITQPRDILLDLNERILKLSQNNLDDSIRDGVDIGICMINKRTNQMFFSGASRPLMFEKDGEIHEIAGDKASIAGHYVNPDYVFDEHVIDLSEINRFFLYTDGLIDQFGGPKGKKFKRSGLQKVLNKEIKSSMMEKGYQLHQSIEFWMQNEDQVDDITILGYDTSKIKWPHTDWSESSALIFNV